MEGWCRREEAGWWRVWPSVLIRLLHVCSGIVWQGMRARPSCRPHVRCCDAAEIEAKEFWTGTVRICLRLNVSVGSLSQCPQHGSVFPTPSSCTLVSSTVSSQFNMHHFQCQTCPFINTCSSSLSCQYSLPTYHPPLISSALPQKNSLLLLGFPPPVNLPLHHGQPDGNITFHLRATSSTVHFNCSKLSACVRVFVCP